MTKRTAFEASIEKSLAMKQAEASGLVADSLEVRKALMEQVADGTITLEQAQKELAKIKRNAKKQGLTTRAQAFSKG